MALFLDIKELGLVKEGWAHCLPRNIKVLQKFVRKVSGCLKPTISKASKNLKGVKRAFWVTFTAPRRRENLNLCSMGQLAPHMRPSQGLLSVG